MGKQLKTFLDLREKKFNAALKTDNAFVTAYFKVDEQPKKPKKKNGKAESEPGPMPAPGICEALNDLKTQLQSEGQTIADMIEAINSLLADFGCGA